MVSLSTGNLDLNACENTALHGRDPGAYYIRRLSVLALIAASLKLSLCLRSAVVRWKDSLHSMYCGAEPSVVINRAARDPTIAVTNMASVRLIWHWDDSEL